MDSKIHSYHHNIFEFTSAHKRKKGRAVSFFKHNLNIFVEL